MKTPLTYYGGKQKMLSVILPRIPAHDLYVEPFIGGGAVFWAKKPAQIEVINDLNGCLITFYRVFKKRLPELLDLINQTLYSRQEHKTAYLIYQTPHLWDDVKVAWAVFILSSQGFLSEFSETWGTSNTPSHGGDSTIKRFNNRKEMLNENCAGYSRRLEICQIEMRDAVEVIRLRDAPKTFTYCDPPYHNADQGHYAGYTREQYRELLETLAGLEGKFLLSSYDCPMLQDFIREKGWHSVQIEKSLDAGIVKKGKRNRKVEVLTANYPLAI